MENVTHKSWPAGEAGDQMPQAMAEEVVAMLPKATDGIILLHGEGMREDGENALAVLGDHRKVAELLWTALLAHTPLRDAFCKMLPAMKELALKDGDTDEPQG